MRRPIVLAIVVGLLLAACGVEPPRPSSTPQASSIVPLSRFDADWFSFEYPAAWAVISEHEQCTMHGPLVGAAVGIGSIDLEEFVPIHGPGDRPRPMAEVGPVTVTADGVACTDPIWSVPEAGVVVAYHIGGTCCPTPPQPRPTLGPGEEFVEVDGVQAVFSQTESGLLWYLFCGGPEFCGGDVYIEARWGPQADIDVKSQVQALVESWKWREEQANSDGSAN